MRIRKYIAHTMKEAIERMRTELGEDAVILSSRALPKANGRQGEMVEITGALDTNEEIPTRPALQHTENSATPNALEIQRYAEMYAREAAGEERKYRNGNSTPARPSRSVKYSSSGIGLRPRNSPRGRLRFAFRAPPKPGAICTFGQRESTKFDPEGIPRKESNPRSRGW